MNGPIEKLVTASACSEIIQVKSFFHRSSNISSCVGVWASELRQQETWDKKRNSVYFFYSLPESSFYTILLSYYELSQIMRKNTIAENNSISHIRRASYRTRSARKCVSFSGARARQIAHNKFS